MKTTLTSLILFTIFSLNTIAQDTSRMGVAKARLGIGRGSIYDVKYSLDGTRLTAASSSGVWLYDLATGDAVALMRQGNSFSATSVAFSPDGRTLASADNDGGGNHPGNTHKLQQAVVQSAENLEDVEDGIVNIPDLVLAREVIAAHAHIRTQQDASGNRR